MGKNFQLKKSANKSILKIKLERFKKTFKFFLLSKLSLFFPNKNLIFILGLLCIVFLYIFSPFNYLFLKILLLLKIFFFLIMGLMSLIKNL